MNKLRALLLFGAGCTLLLLGCSNKNSSESCQHEVTMNLDRGNNDAVIASGCANPMQKGAAYFGRAGYDPKDVLNNFIQSDTSSGSTGTKPTLTSYMTTLIGRVTENSLADLDSASTQYRSIPVGAELYKDAQFSVSLVDAIKSLSLLKVIVADVTGDLNTNCDINTNTIKDGADAASCALIASNNINTSATTSCNKATYARSNPIDISFTGKSGTYSGIVVTLTGTGTTACPAVYRKLLYKDTAGKYWAVAASSDQVCVGSDTVSWPCPMEQNGQPLDLVAAVDSSLNSAINSLNSSLTSAGTSSQSDVQQSVQDIKNNACPGTCTSTNISNYLLTIK